MKIKRIVVQNFKSYKDTIIDKLSPKVNIIVGQNGHGKSNVHIALLFLFSDLYTSESAQTKREVLYEGLPMNSEVYVEALVDNSEGLFQGEESDLYLRKTITEDGKLSWRVNNRLVSGTEYETMLELAGIRKTNPSNFILQGKIKRVSQTDETGLYTLLEEIVGTRFYEERKTESKELIQSVMIDEKKAHEMLDDFRGKLHEIQVDKEDYKKYEQDLQAGNLIYHTLYSRKVQQKTEKRLEVDKIIEGSRGVIMQLRQHMFEMSGKIATLEQQLAENRLELQNSDVAVNELAGEIQKHTRHLETLKSASDNAEVQESLLSHKELSKKKAEAEKQREASYLAVVRLQKDLKEMQGQLELCKIKREQLLQLKIGGPAALKQLMAKQMEHLNVAIKSRQDEVKAEEQESSRLEVELKKHTATLEQHEADERNHVSQESKLLEEIRNLEGEKTSATSVAVNSKYGLANSKDRMIELQTQVEELRKKVEVGSNLHLTGILRLMDELKVGRVEGVHGILIDLFDISSKILTFTDLIIPSSNLFAIVVRDEEVARQVDRINKALRGPRIRLFPLTWLQEDEGTEERTYPDKREKAIIIEKYVQIKSSFSDLPLQSLISHVFGGNLVVEKLEDAHKLASTFDCNCITFDNQIVYANNFMSHLGFRDQKDSHLKRYLEFRSKHTELQKLKIAIEQETEKAETAREQELSAQQKISELRMAREQMRWQENQQREETNAQRKAVLQLRKLLQESELRVLDLKGELQALESERNELLSNKSSSKVDKYDEKTFLITETEFSQLNTKLKAMLHSLEKETNSLTETDLLVQKYAEDLRVSEKGQISMQNNKVEKSMLQQEIKKTKELLASLEKHLEDRKSARQKIKQLIESETSELSKLEIEIRAKKSEVEKAQQELQGLTQSKFDLTLNIDTFSNKIEQLGISPSEHKDNLRKLAGKPDKDLVALLKNLLMSKLKYTDKDKVNFEKLEEYFEHHHEYEDELNNLKAGKRIFFQMVDKVDQRVEEINRNSFKNFRNHFSSIFEQIVPQGFADLELIDVKAPNTQTQVSERRLDTEEAGPRKGIRIISNFETDRKIQPNTQSKGVSNLAALSPGQKTVISICIIMALQKCCPSPFYCFDEIDADLDQAYVRAITRVIEQVSQTSQIFMTTFRPEALNLKDANIFKVEMQNARSEVYKMPIAQAKEFLQR